MNVSSLSHSHLALGLMLSILLGSALTFAGSVSADSSQRGERNPAVQQAILSADYEAFLEATDEDSRIREHVTAQNISDYAQLAEIKESGASREEVQSFAQELGLELPQRRDRSGHRHDPAVQQAILSADYEAFLEATDEDSRIREHVTAQNISDYAQLAEIKESGASREEVQSLAEDLGLELPDKVRRDRGQPRGERGQARADMRPATL